MSDDRMVWIDTETFGLVPKESPIIEVGIVITDLDLRQIAGVSLKVWEPWYTLLLRDLKAKADGGNKDAKFVYDMHESSGLWARAEKDGLPVAEAVTQLVAFLMNEDVDKTDPMCGSSIQFDRNMLDFYMPQVSEIFSYRNIDVSTVKELCRRYNPTIYSHLKTDVSAAFAHTVLSDIEDSILEFQFYRDEFLMWKD